LASAGRGSHRVGKADIHHRILTKGGEGTVWKQESGCYEPGRRVKHWIKRKAAVGTEAIVTGWKPGNPERGHAHSVGALEFSSQQADGSLRPVAWVSSWSDAERRTMSQYTTDGQLQLNPAYRGRHARIVGHDHSAKSQRFRHARFVQWLDGESSNDEAPTTATAEQSP
jgi:bifunctional non-homologous end joining protein LigD